MDINVVVQHMEYHLLKVENWDAFDPGKPALLVYSKNPANGKMRLVAVEYAVPNTGQAPEGFTGNEDAWNMMEVLISGDVTLGSGIIIQMESLKSIIHV